MDFLMKHILDIILLLILLFAAWRGYKNGFVKSFATLAALALGIWGAAKLSAIFAQWVEPTVGKSNHYLPIVSFIVVFIIIVILVLLFARLMSSMMNDGGMGTANKIAGIVINVAKYALSLSIVLVIIDRLNNRLNFMEPMLTHDSVLWSPFLSMARWFYSNLPL